MSTALSPYSRFLSKRKKHNFIGEYMRYMQDTETPRAYDFWCACWLISCAVARRVIVPRPNAPVFLNLYAVLVAESAITRKSAAVKRAEDVLAALIEKTRKPFGLVTSRMSPEALLMRMHELSGKTGRAEIAICISELVTFLGKEGYLTNMPGLLTDLYDCPSRRKSFGTIAHGKQEINNVWMSMLSASTPTWLIESINPNVVAGGFTSRCMFIAADKRKQLIAWSDKPQPDMTPLVDNLKWIHDHSYQIEHVELSQRALAYFKKWYSGRRLSSDAYLSSFEGREDAHVLRLAALIAISEDSWLIDLDNLKIAIEIIDMVKRDGMRIFDKSIIAMSDTEIIIERVRSRLINAGTVGLSESDLIRSMGGAVSKDMLKALLYMLHEMELVDKLELGSSLSKRKRYHYVSRKALLDKSTFATIVNRFALS